MSPMEARLQCLRLAVDTQGNPNKVHLAQQYLTFLREDETPTKSPEARIERKPSRDGKGN